MEDRNSLRVGISEVPIKALKALGELSCSAVLLQTVSNFLRSNFIHKLELQLEVGNPGSWGWKRDCGRGKGEPEVCDSESS